MVNIDYLNISNEIDYYGDSVTIRSVTKSLSASKWGDAAETTSDTASIPCIVNVLSESDDIVREGTFSAGDMIFFFKQANSSIIVNGNRILYNDHWFEIIDVRQYRLASTLYAIEARTKKI